ncbi:hypothetical protein SUGI_0355890 [Cryptomeria japonica]|nr:hypothetical protein SUGI_0355890 [Cryptomeria japonica]
MDNNLMVPFPMDYLPSLGPTAECKGAEVAKRPIIIRRNITSLQKVMFPSRPLTWIKCQVARSGFLPKGEAGICLGGVAKSGVSSSGPSTPPHEEYVYVGQSLLQQKKSK